MASEFERTKEKSKMTPLSDWVATSLYDITHELAKTQGVTHNDLVRTALTQYVNANGYPEYVYPTKVSLSQENANLKAQLEAMRAELEAAKKKA